MIKRGPGKEKGSWDADKDGKSGGGDQSCVEGGTPCFTLLYMTLILRFVKSEETLDIVRSGFGLPTCLARTVFKCLN